MSDEDTRSDESGATPPVDAEDTDSAPRRGRGGQAILWLLLIALGIGAWYWHERVHKPATAAMTARLAAAEARSDAMAAEIAAAAAESTAQRAEQNATLGARLDGLASQADDLTSSVRALYAKQAQESLDWVLAEVEYLVLAASQRLALEHDVDTALAALRAADRRLRAAEHPELIDLRQVLTGDVSALEAVDQPDIEGLALYLAEAVTRSEKLPTRPIADLDMPLTRLSDDEVEKKDIAGYARALWADVKSLVEVKDGELEDGVLFDPKLRYFLRQNLRLDLASARLAVLKRDTGNFRASVTLAIDLLDTYYDTGAGTVKALRKRLHDELALELDPPVPNVSASLEAVRAKRDAVRDAAVAGN